MLKLKQQYQDDNTNTAIPPHVMIWEVTKTTASQVERSLGDKFKLAFQRLAGFNSMQGASGVG